MWCARLRVPVRPRALLSVSVPLLLGPDMSNMQNSRQPKNDPGWQEQLIRTLLVLLDEAGASCWGYTCTGSELRWDPAQLSAMIFKWSMAGRTTFISSKCLRGCWTVKGTVQKYIKRLTRATEVSEKIHCFLVWCDYSFNKIEDNTFTGFMWSPLGKFPSFLDPPIVPVHHYCSGECGGVPEEARQHVCRGILEIKHTSYWESDQTDHCNVCI